MKMLTYEGSWPVCLSKWDGELAAVVDASGNYSRHSHFVQALRRAAGDGCMVFSRKQVCYITRR